MPGFRRRSSRLKTGKKRDPIEDLMRRVVMVRAGAFEVEGDSGERARWYGRCQHPRCGRMDYLFGCHYFTRGIKRTMYDTRNVWAFCSRCHYFVDEVEPRHRLERSSFTDFVIAQIGEVEYADLCAQARGKDAEGVPVAVRRRSPSEWRVVLHNELAGLLNGGAA